MQESISFRQNMSSHNLQCLPLQFDKHWQLANFKPNYRTIKVKLLAFYFPSVQFVKYTSSLPVFCVRLCTRARGDSCQISGPSLDADEMMTWMKYFCYFANALGQERQEQVPVQAGRRCFPACLAVAPELAGQCSRFTVTRCLFHPVA